MSTRAQHPPTFSDGLSQSSRLSSAVLMPSPALRNTLPFKAPPQLTRCFWLSVGMERPAATFRSFTINSAEDSLARRMEGW